MAFKHGMMVDLCMAYYAYARFDDLDTRSQWICRGKQYLSVAIQTAHDGRRMHDILYGYVRLNDLDRVLDSENVRKARPPCFILLLYTLFFGSLFPETIQLRQSRAAIRE